MKIKSLHIKNFKSLVDLEIVDPNPFTVFVGANGVGKSNIFEALEFASYLYEWNSNSAVRLFGGEDSINARAKSELVNEDITVAIQFEDIQFLLGVNNTFSSVPEFDEHLDYQIHEVFSSDEIAEPSLEFTILKNAYYNSKSQFITFFSRIFIKNEALVKVKETGDEKLGISCSNLEKVLKRLLQDANKRDEIKEYLQLFIPEFENIEIHSDNIGGTDSILIYEKGAKRPFNKNLISDGTYNLICLLTALYQSDEPQFLCIEEPENGLTPDVIKELALVFRNACEEKGHYIWLNTHSQSLVSQLSADELITVDKINGETKIKQFKGKDFHGLRMDEVWLTNSLGAGLPW